MKSQDSQLLLTRSAQTRLIEEGGVFALQWCMKEPSAKRQRTLALHERALRFSCNVNRCCPERFSGLPSSRVWDQLIRAADSTSNNLVEADGASSDADFLSKMGIALREAKESSAALMKVRVCGLDNAHKAADLNLESEAGQLAAIFATIILKMRLRLDEEARRRRK
jgi:four helix bundle protein